MLQHAVAAALREAAQQCPGNTLALHLLAIGRQHLKACDRDEGKLTVAFLRTVGAK